MKLNNQDELRAEVLSDEQVVRQKYPDARVIDWRGPHGMDNTAYYVYPNGLIFQAISRGWSTVADAWADARARLAATPKPVVAPKPTSSAQQEEDPRNGFLVEITMHTDEAREKLASPEDVRHRVGFALEANSELEEEIDFTITVRRASTPVPAAQEEKKIMQVKPAFDRIISREDEAKRRDAEKMDPATFNYDSDEEIPQRVWLMPIFDAIWDEIKTWDINVPTEYVGYSGATGTHVHAILKAMANRGLVVLPKGVPDDTPK